MSISYGNNLGLVYITPGTESGLWGGYTNTNITDLLVQAIAGYTTQPITDGADTVIVISNGSSSPAGNNVARNAALKLTGALTAQRNLVVPTVSKLYFINNATTGGFAVVVKTAAQVTGITVPNGKAMALLVDGANVVEAVTYVSGVAINSANPSASIGLTAVNGTATTFMTSDSAPALSQAITPTWTGAHIFSAAVTLNGTVSGTGLSSYLSTYLASPPAIGGTTAAAGTFTTLIAKKAYTPTSAIGTVTTSLTVDASLSNVFTATTTAANNIGTVTINNLADGQTINILITQSASGNSQLTATAWAKWPGGAPSAPVLTQSNAAKDLIVVTNIGGTLYATISKAFA